MVHIPYLKLNNKEQRNQQQMGISLSEPCIQRQH